MFRRGSVDCDHGGNQYPKGGIVKPSNESTPTLARPPENLAPVQVYAFPF